MPRSLFFAATTALVSILSLTSCAAAPAPVIAPVVAPAPPPPPPPDPSSRVHVLMINGGGNPNINFQPHVLHLRALRDTLLASGIKPDHVTVFASDGADPAPDLVSRAPQPEDDFWMIEETRLEHPLEMPRTLESTTIPGVELHAATKANLKAWFEAEAKVLHPGDTLLLYVTDHGNRGPDPMANTIQLWGKDELSVTELRDLLHGIPRSVRVVSLMSQCFSGAFAALSATRANEPPPNVCGYFASTADRPAYGCYAENVGKERVGHSFHFIRALASSRRMEDAHAQVLADDDTPDVPLRSSDVFLEEQLRRAASDRAITVETLATELLGPAWRDQPAWKDDRALVDRIAAAFGLAAPQSIAQLGAEHAALVDLTRRFDSSVHAWMAAKSDATSGNLDGFLAANPTWNERLADGALQSIKPDAARTLTASLLGELAPWTRKEHGDRLDTLQKRLEATDEASYRTQIRVAAALRVRTVLVSLAGRVYLERSGTKAQKDAYEALRACENFELPGSPPPAAEPAPDANAFASLPSIADDEKLERDTHPAWIGIAFSMIPDDLKKERKLPSGALLVTSVSPTGPAHDGDLRVGDVILGPPGKPFTGRNEIRPWTMLTPPGQSGTLDVQRAGKQIEITLVPKTLPIDLPQAAPPAGPEIGKPAPALSLRTYRGAKVNLKDGKPHLLLFWATWCKPCKASLPEALAYERTHHTQIVAITDESKGILDGFFKTWKAPFPQTIAIDDFRLNATAYGVTGTPGFVLIDGKGIVRARSTGYSNPPGLPIDGWKWDGK